MKPNIKSSQQKGFTIIELMIATAVLSTMLMLVTSVMIGIGRLYYKGINQARIQSNVRSLSDEVAQSIQLSDLDPRPGTAAADGTQAYCFGNTRYSYVLDKQISTQTAHVLWRDKIPAGTCAALPLTTATPGTAGTELIAPQSRLTDFSISNSSPFKIVVGMAYGDDDLLCNKATAGDCDSDTTSSSLTSHGYGDIRCKGKEGLQFCATSTLDSVVVRRISN